MGKTMRTRIMAIIIVAAMFLTACGDTTSKETENTKTVLTVGTVSASTALKKQVDIFNQQNPHVLIEIKEYGETTVVGSNAVNTIQMEISAGGGPDIIDFGYLYSPSAVSKGITEDLFSYIKADEDFHEEDYFGNIINAFAVEDKLYAISPEFSIQSVAGRRQDLGDAVKWNMMDMMEYFRGKTKESILFPGDTKKEVFGFLCMGSMGNFVDWTNGTCNFEDGLFKEILTFSNQFPAQRVYEDNYSVLQQFQSGKALLYPVYIADMYGCTKVRIIFGDTPINYIGYPMDEKSGNIAQPGKIVLGINKNSKNKEAAWEFIKSFLQEEYQSNIKSGIPLLKSETERRLEEAKEIEYEQSASGDEVGKVKDSIVFEGEDPINIICIEEQDAIDILRIINSVETAYAVDQELYSIILEEVTYYFEDNRDLDSVIKIIQSRASIYVSENH